VSPWQLAFNALTVITAGFTAWLSWSKLRTERQLQSPVFEFGTVRWRDDRFEFRLVIRNRGHDRLAIRRVCILKPKQAAFTGSDTDTDNTKRCYLDEQTLEPNDSNEFIYFVTTPEDRARHADQLAEQAAAERDPGRISYKPPLAPIPACTVRVEYTRGSTATKVRTVMLHAKAH
jgi:hypothetical protein